MRYLKLTLKGIMQSYGTKESAFPTVRGTGMHPTASAVAGIIACALGIRKGDPAYDALLLLDYRTTLPSHGDKLYDYQIVAPKEPGKSSEESAFYGLDGSKKKQVPVVKCYLYDECFTVLVGSEDEDGLRRIHHALRHPKWIYTLGRACCIPSGAVVPKTFTLEDAAEAEKEEYICI